LLGKKHSRCGRARSVVIMLQLNGEDVHHLLDGASRYILTDKNDDRTVAYMAGRTQQLADHLATKEAPRVAAQVCARMRECTSGKQNAHFTVEIGTDRATLVFYGVRHLPSGNKLHVLLDRYSVPLSRSP